jgi:hypothetical protein
MRKRYCDGMCDVSTRSTYYSQAPKSPSFLFNSSHSLLFDCRYANTTVKPSNATKFSKTSMLSLL